MPTLTTLFKKPDTFFRQLSRLPYRPARFLWLVSFSSIPFLLAMLSGEASRVVLRLTIGEGWLLATFLIAVLQPVFQWLFFWVLSHLALGKAGRPAEVFGLSFFIPTLFSLGLLLWTLLFSPPLLTHPPDLTGLSDEMREQLTQAYADRVSQEPAQSRLKSWQGNLGYLALLLQGVFAWYGFRQITGDTRKALWGVALPLGTFGLLKLLREGF